jgi:hypothetical protein
MFVAKIYYYKIILGLGKFMEFRQPQEYDSLSRPLILPFLGLFAAERYKLSISLSVCQHVTI